MRTRCLVALVAGLALALTSPPLHAFWLLPFAVAAFFIVTDNDEGLFASYSDVQFKEPVRAGDVVEVVCDLVRVGSRSRGLELSVIVVARGNPSAEHPGGAELLDPPLVATTATGTVVVPA
jgi:3-aminobutyryl-CoA ammonia-lyase